VFASTTSGGRRGRSVDLPEGSPIRAVAPPITMMGSTPHRAKW